MAESHREEIAKLEALYASNPGGRVFVHLAEAYRKAGEHDRARRILHEGLERHADSASAYVVLGRVLADVEEDNEAEAAFRRVLELDGGNLVALRWLGDIARKNGRLAEARSHYRDLLARNPHNTEIQDLLASVESAAAEAPADEQQPASAAPGYADGESAEPEFGIVELDDLPGDLGAFAGVAPPRDQSIQEKSLEEELGIVGAFDEQGEEETFELKDLESQVTEEPLDEHILESSLEVETFGAAFEDEQPAEPELPVDISDMNVPEETLEDDYMAGSIDLSGFEEPEEESAELETQPIDAGGLEQAPEFEAPVYGGDLPALDAADLDEPTEFAGEGPASLATPQDFADPETYADDVEFPGEGTEDAPAETLLEPMETEAAQEPATFSPEPPETMWEAPAEQPADESVETEYETEPATFETAYSPASEPEAFDAEPESAPPEPEQPFMPVDPLQAASERLEADSLTEEQWAEAGAAEAVPLEGVESAFSDVVGGSAAEVDEDTDGLVTETMAELYRSQGFADRAADVYRTLLRRRPHDERLRARLEELEESLAVPQVQSVFEEDESGEVWLRGVGTTWTGAMPVAHEPETPYAWTATSEDAPAGEPVGTFLRSLVQWRPSQTSAAPPPQAEPEPLLLDEHAEVQQPAAAEPPAPVTPPSMPATDPWASATRDDTPSADPWGAPSPAQTAAPDSWAPPAPQPRTPAASDPWGAPPAPAQPDPWTAPPPESRTPEADAWASPATPSPAREDPWDAPPSSQSPQSAAPQPWAPPPPSEEPRGVPPAAPAAPEPWAPTPPRTDPVAPEPWAAAAESSPEPWSAPPVQSPAPATPNRGASPVEAAFDEWYSPGSEAAAAAPQPAAPAEPEPPAAAPPSAAPQSQRPGDESDAEDEDLEMFRSWLQSLKK